MQRPEHAVSDTDTPNPGTESVFVTINNDPVPGDMYSRRVIPGWPGYTISRIGAVYSDKNPMRALVATQKNGYWHVTLDKGKTRQQVPVHRLIAFAFVDETTNEVEVRHLDGDTDHNFPENLQWGSHAQNMQDMLKHGTHNEASRTECDNGHSFEDPANWRWEVDAKGSDYRRCILCEKDKKKRQKSKVADVRRQKLIDAGLIEGVE